MISATVFRFYSGLLRDGYDVYDYTTSSLLAAYFIANAS